MAKRCAARDLRFAAKSSERVAAADPSRANAEAPVSKNGSIGPTRVRYHPLGYPHVVDATTPHHGVCQAW